MALELAHEVNGGDIESIPQADSIREKIIFAPDSIVTLTTTTDLDSVTKSDRN